MDLFWSTSDPNGLPLNPDWRAHLNPRMVEDDHVDLFKACSACDPDPNCVDACLQDGSDPGCSGCRRPPSCWSECTRSPLSLDNSLLFSDLSFVCGDGGHVNWRPVTYQGTLEFQDYNARGFLHSIFYDDDYTFKLTPPNREGLAGRPEKIHSEMSFLETVDRFRDPDGKIKFWDDFRDRVENIHGEDLSSPRALFGKEGILVGLLNLDLEHGRHVEIHPIYAMAVNTTESRSTSCWAMFARNWGNEGGCSRKRHPLGLSEITLRLPQAGATAVKEVSRAFRGSPGLAVSEVGLVKDGAEITFFLADDPKGEKETRIFGEVCLSWAVAPGVKRLPTVRPATDLADANRDEGFPGIDLLTPAQLAQLAASSLAGKAWVKNLDTVVTKRGLPSVARPAKMRSAPVVAPVGPLDVAKQTREREIQRRICKMLSGNPKRPAICNRL